LLGKTLGHYEIVDLLGRGGMGEVYRARDTRLGRVVALKILPRELSGDPERVARFQREARTLASLQHPNIASVYGYDEVDGVRFLAMELVEGEDLSARIARGPLPEDEAVEVLRRIAAALDAAHAMSIVHRDLKPANIKLTLEGDVKVLDFGLARAYAGDSEIEGDPTLSPTITAAMTQAGTILGTAAYMAPEQARGRRVDHRVDIWAMGVILYEMLVGRRLFEGDTVTDVLAGVITIQPDLGRVPESTSAPVRRILQRCLQKDPARRLRAAADAVLELDLPFDHAPPGIAETSGRLSRTWPWLVSAALTIAIIVLLLPAGGQDLAPIHSKHYDLAFGPQFRTSSTYEPYISPDGDWVAVAISDTLGRPLTYLRSIRTGELRILDGSADENNFFWSPDSRYLGFQTRGRLHKLHVETLSSQLIGASGQFQGRGASWSKNNQILFAPNANSSLLLIDAEGGNAIEVTQLDTTLVDASHRWPKFLPDGRRFLFTLWSNLKEERASVGGIYLGSLDGGTPHRLLRDVSEALFARSGQILFHRDGRLMAVDFDWEGGTIESEPRVISDVVAFTPTNGKLGASISDAGEIVLSPLRQDLDCRRPVL